MFGTAILDVSIGIVFIFLLASIVASAIREGIEAWLKTRASHLEAGLREVLNDPAGNGLVQDLYNHPLISSLYSGDYSPNPKLQSGSPWRISGRNLPSYIPSANFAIALMDMAARGPKSDAGISTAPLTLDSIRANVGTIENPEVRRALLIAIDTANGEFAKAQANLEGWYNSVMDRVSGWYKRSTQNILLALGLVIAVSFNISTVRIADTLYNDKSVRDMVVASAEKQAGSTPIPYVNAVKDLRDLNVLVGWPQTRQEIAQELCDHWFADISGWILTAFAVSFGAPFWFDMLNRLIVIRSTVKPHQKSPEESSTDNASSTAPAPSSLSVPQAATPPPEAVPVAQPVQAIAPFVAATDPDGCDIDKTSNITPDELLPAAL